MKHAFERDVTKNLKPIYDEQKKQFDHRLQVLDQLPLQTPNDWDVAIGLHANYAALDQVAAKAAMITIQHYYADAMCAGSGEKSDPKSATSSQTSWRER